ncbi:hypothetical protein BGZ63DRAFT_425739 [Mariannaea sp. PMI_226]|nr:hypothetical protein BGZ63DRAFT_425739 [Mariannaea sp. PMI_226]
MKGAVLYSVVSASVVAAQGAIPPGIFDLAPKLTIAPEIFQIAATHRKDAEYTTCSAVAAYVDECIPAISGTTTALDASSLLSCACCVSATPIHTLYSECSSYLVHEGGTSFRDTYSAYSELYQACGRENYCAQGTNTPTTTAYDTKSYAPACSKMVDIYTSCTKKVDNFTDLPNRKQAGCLCCHTEGHTAHWTNALDNYARTCAAWAKTGDETAFRAARLLATLCDNYTDVCRSHATTHRSATTTTDSSAVKTVDSTSHSPSRDQEAATVTVTVQTTETGKPELSHSGAGSLQVSSFNVLFATVLALTIAL